MKLQQNLSKWVSVLRVHFLQEIQLHLSDQQGQQNYASQSSSGASVSRFMCQQQRVWFFAFFS
jgi:hypothetical protein